MALEWSILSEPLGKKNYMKSFILKSLSIATLSISAVAVFAQGDWSGCIDPMNKNPFSNPFLYDEHGDNLFVASVGAVGTVTYGGSDATARCFVPTAVTAKVVGRVGFSMGSDGSVQSTVDDGMPLTFGFPYPGADWSYANVVEDKTKTVFGANALNLFFVGASDRYIYAETTNNKIDVVLRVDILADAARLQWTLTNNDTASHNLGLWFGQWVAMIDGTGLEVGGPLPIPYTANADKPLEYIITPGQKPIITEQRYRRDTDSTNFPSYVNFELGQTNAYGLQVINGPTPATEDSQGLNSDATPVDEMAIGSDFFLIGNPLTGGDTTFPDFEFGPVNAFGERSPGDVRIDDSPAYIQKYFDNVSVPASTSRVIVSYYRDTTGVSNYYRPYSVLVDGPQLMPTDSSNPTGLQQPPGGYDVRVWIDNTRGFSTIDQSIELDDVKVTLTLPPGINLTAGDTSTKIIAKILPGSPNISFVDFHVQPDGVNFGQLPYSVTVEPNPGPTKTVSAVFNVPTTPKLALHQGANLVSTPFIFADSSWESVLGLSTPTDFQAFNYDPTQNGYVPALSVARGKASWIVSNTELGVRTLQGDPKEPTDLVSNSDNSGGAPSINIQPGWNLIADPYDYAFPLGQIIGVSNASPNTSYTFQQLVNLGYVNPALALYSTQTSSYTYVQNLSDLIQPDQGYWIFNATNDVITLKYPPIFQEFLPNSSRATAAVWPQTDSQWRLQLAARTNSSVDSNNYIGFVQSPALEKTLVSMKPPMSPSKDAVQLSVEGTFAGKPTRMATALSTSATSTQYIVDVYSKNSGPVTLTWPNLNTLPKDVQARLVDTATGITRSINQSSGYTFNANGGTTRQFKVQLQSGTQSTATIGNVVVSRPTRSPNSPFAITYTLSGSATTSIRILSASGNEVATITSGRADQAGQNIVSWNLRDNANRSVAPGVYRVEIVAETANGDRVRKIVSLNVTR